jgi:hypothetical protein
MTMAPEERGAVTGGTAPGPSSAGWGENQPVLAAEGGPAGPKALAAAPRALEARRGCPRGSGDGRRPEERTTP